MEKQQGRQQESWSTVPVSEKMAKDMAAPAAVSDRAARMMQQKIIRLAEKAFKRQQAAAAATGKPFTAPQWKKKKNRSKIAKKSRKNNR